MYLNISPNALRLLFKCLFHQEIDSNMKNVFPFTKLQGVLCIFTARLTNRVRRDITHLCYVTAFNNYKILV